MSNTARVIVPALTEAELLTMSEEDYMNEAQLAFFENLLAAMRVELVEEIRQVRLELVVGGDREADEVDQAASEEERWLNLRIHERKTYLIRKVDEAMRLIQSGDYGWCEDSGEPIGLKRLLARPTATLCIEAKERRECMERQRTED